MYQLIAVAKYWFFTCHPEPLFSKLGLAGARELSYKRRRLSLATLKWTQKG